MEQWEKVQGDLGKTVRWNEVASNPKEAEKTVYVGLVVQGVYEERRDGVGQHQSTVYGIRTEQHGLLNVWGTTLLDDLMGKIPTGNEVRIERTGEATSKLGKTYGTFEVATRKLPMTAVEPTNEVPEM